MAQATHLEAIGQGLCGLLVWVFLSVAAPSLHAQKVGEIDLTREPPEPKVENAAAADCKGAEQGFSHSDGYMLSLYGAIKLDLRIVSLSSMQPALGSTVEAEISLKNADTANIVIPWSADPATAHRPAEAMRNEYEAASIQMWMKDERGRQEFLKSVSVPVYSSDAHPGSTLTLLPGQWAILRIKFRLLVDEKEPSHSLATGPAQLRAVWRQARYTWQRDGCSVNSSYSSYSGFYEQRAEPIYIFVASRSEEPVGSTPPTK